MAPADRSSVTRKSSSRSACSRRSCFFTSCASSISEAISSSLEARRSRAIFVAARRARCRERGPGAPRAIDADAGPMLRSTRAAHRYRIRQIVSLNRVRGNRHSIEVPLTASRIAEKVTGCSCARRCCDRPGDARGGVAPLLIPAPAQPLGRRRACYRRDGLAISRRSCVAARSFGGRPSAQPRSGPSRGGLTSQSRTSCVICRCSPYSPSLVVHRICCSAQRRFVSI